MSITLRQVKLEDNERLTDQQILEYIEDFQQSDYEVIDNLENYYLGENTTIEKRTDSYVYSDSGTPNNVIAVPYGRKIVNTVLGYAFKPGLITYNSENIKYIEKLQDVNYWNIEAVETSQIARDVSAYGVGYELHYIEDMGGRATPRFTRVSAKEIIPIWDYSIEPKLSCVIRFYSEVNNSDQTRQVIEVYYKDIIQTYITDFMDTVGISSSNYSSMKLESEDKNMYNLIPFVVFRNNEEFIGDYEHILSLIDAYDNLTSDSMNEFERFASAYLRLVGSDIDKKDLDKVKAKRIFMNLENKDAVTFLTKDINTEYITFMSDLIRMEIHKQSNIPDMSDEKFAGNSSGVAIRFKLSDFENLISQKEAYFKQGLFKRYLLVNSILGIRDNERRELRELEIKFQRNIPANLQEIAEIALKSKGILSDKTILKLYPSDWVHDIYQELEQIKEDNQNMVDFDTMDMEENAETDGQ